MPGHFEGVLRQVTAREPKSGGGAAGGRATPRRLSPEKKKLLALTLRKQAPAGRLVPGRREGARMPRLFWFPHAGGGARAGGATRDLRVPVRLPGREARIAEAPFERMAPLVEALAAGHRAIPGPAVRLFRAQHGRGGGV